MSYVTILWSAAAAAALLLGLVHGLVWLYDRRARANLAFACAGIGLAWGAIAELGMLQASTPEAWGEWVWWMHPPIFVIVSGMAIFLRLYLGAGRIWLLSTIIALRGLLVVLNFGSDPNVNFERIDAIAQIYFLGEQVSVVSNAVVGKYQWIALLTSFLFPLFILDVVVTLWRRRTPDARRVALVIGGPVFLAVTISVALTQLVIWRMVELPMLLIPPFLISLGAMTVELSRDMLRASRLARDLRESEQRLELAAKAAGAGLWAWDAESGRIWATEQTRAMLGLGQTGDIDAIRLLQIADPEDAPELRATVSRALERGGEHAVQFRIAVPKDGRRWIAAHGTVELGPQGELQRVRGVLRDVTRQRLAEDEANELQRKLSHVGRVTMLGQLSTALAHELSQPLSAIQHNAEVALMLLAREPVDLQELREIVGDVVRDDRRASEVVQRLRAWLKQGKLRAEVISLNELAQDVLALVRSNASTKYVTIECLVPQSLPPVVGDRIHLSQVLLNLIMNAMDAIIEGGGTRRRVIIEAHRMDSDCCEISVSDSGPGIAPEKLDQIFEPFFTTKAEGMGIGLSISRTIVEAHGGKLWAENAAHGGATFRFTVPLQVVEELSRV